MALVLNLIADQGSTFNYTLNLLDDNGMPLNVTGKLFRGQFRKSYASVNGTDFVIRVVDATKGVISLFLDAAVTRNAIAGRYVYDIEMYDNTGGVTRLREGQIEFTPAATSTTIIPPTPLPYRLSGSGSPEGIVMASPGYSYVDTTSGTLYFKMTGIAATGWQPFVQL
jgi:hypothetical protein